MSKLRLRSMLLTLVVLLAVLVSASPASAQQWGTRGLTFPYGNTQTIYGTVPQPIIQGQVYGRPGYGFGYTAASRPSALWTVGVRTQSGRIIARQRIARSSYDAAREVRQQFPYSQIAYVRLEFSVRR